MDVNPNRNVPRQECPFCGQKQDLIIQGMVIENGNIDFVKDRGYSFCNCKNIFYTDWANIKPEIYDAAYADKYQNETANAALKQNAEYVDKICSLLTPGKVLEIGCVNPILLDLFKAKGAETHALDIIPHKFEGHNNITVDFEKWESGELFDVIWASHIFEHFRDPLAMIEKCGRLLNPGGCLFVAMPDPYFIDYANVYQWMHWHIKEHYIMWNKDSFEVELKNKGFEITIGIHNCSTYFICIGDFHILARKAA